MNVTDPDKESTPGRLSWGSEQEIEGDLRVGRQILFYYPCTGSILLLISYPDSRHYSPDVLKIFRASLREH